ncbi:MAG: protoporphyrinogen oxidase [Myxococcales bacterium]|nr:protoporphyrinogen oxidase [Myxococcales bacterium]
MIAIVGGGISGLSLAHALKAKGREGLLLEAEPRVGGTIRTTTRDGFIAEWGPNGFLDKEPKTRELVSALGLEGRLRAAEPTSKRRFVYSKGKLHEVPLSPPGFLKTELLPLSGKLRALGDLFVSRATQDDESLASFGRRRFGHAAAETLIDAIQTGIYAGNYEKLSARATFPILAELEQRHRSIVVGMVKLQKEKRRAGEKAGSGALTTFEGGLETLVSALADGLRDSVRLGSKVTGLSLAQGRWKITSLTDGTSVTAEAEAVVLAVPAFAAAELLRPLDAKLAAELEAIEYNAVASVQLGFWKADLPSPIEGFGFIVPAHEGHRVIGAIYISSIFPWRSPSDSVLFNCMAGGAVRPDALGLSDEQLVETVLEELRQLLGVAAPPIFRQVVRWPRAIPQYNVGHLARVARIEEAAGRLPGLTLTGNCLRGVGMNDCIRNSAALADRISMSGRG